MGQEQGFFDFAAEVGFTKHLGGVDATDELAELCKVTTGKHLLDVGCGAGVTACYLAREYGCRVTGVDILAEMVARSRERAAKEGLADQLSFEVADAQDLPFDDGAFDAVLTESVTAFPKDKLRAVREYARVTKPGGYVGLNESTWLQEPTPEMAAWVAQDQAGNPRPLSSDQWRVLLEEAGLTDIQTKNHAIVAKDEARGMMGRYGFRGMLGIWGRMLRLYLRNPAYRRFLKELRQGGMGPEQLDAYLGFGLYVGRK
jgi:ubiquinone/menaquinone biosynthesis C-methylase UbiE